jgi:gliding motility-associated-like protein
MKQLVVILLLTQFLNHQLMGQQSYNNCNSALELCPNQLFSVTNSDANKTFCPGCEDDFTFCFTANNSIWFTFTTNAIGGPVQVDFSNLVFETNPGQDNALQATLLSATVPCNAASYTAIGNCVSNGTIPFSLISAALLPSTTYYIVVSGDLSGPGITTAAECSFDLSISGAAVDRPVPTITLTTGAAAICLNDIFTANATVNDCPDTGNYTWYVNGIEAATTTLPTFQTSNLADGAIVSVETSCYLVCAELVTSTSPAISVYSFPLDAGPDLTIATGSSVTLAGSTSASVYVWSPSFYVSNPNSLTPIAFPEETTVFTLSATENGCTLEDYVTITITEKLIFPTTFSPNDDNVNDRWEISGVSNYPNCFVRIFDRWGQEVFQSTGYSKQKAWDGIGKAGKLAEGVYFYIVELRDSDKQEFKGSITLIR